MLRLLLVFCVFCHFSLTDEATFNPTTASPGHISTAGFTGSFSRKIRNSNTVIFSNAKFSPRVKKDIPSKQLEHCICTYSRKDSNRLVNGMEETFKIRVYKGQTAVLSCNAAEMNLVWYNSKFTAKSINLTCIDCRKYTQEEIPSCQGSRPAEPEADIRCERFSEESTELLNVDYEDDGLRVGSRATFSCREKNQSILGNSVTKCGRNAEWSSPPPQCMDPVVRCTKFSDEDLNLLTVYYDDKYIRAGSTANFSCKNNEQELSGKNKSVCYRNGKWSSPLPQCKDTVVRCTRFTELELNLLIVQYDDEDIRVGSIANFSCKDNDKELSGKTETVCRRNGKWSSPPPQCKNTVVRCTRFTERELNLLIVHYDDEHIRVGSTANFSCMDNDQKLSGKNETVCLRNGKWSSPPPQCKNNVVRCTRFTEQELNLLIVDYDDEHIRAGSTANFSCKDNDQQLSGKNETVCLRNGKWSSPPPQCKNTVARCTRFSDQELNLLIVDYDDEDIRAGSTAIFSCKDNDQELSGKNEAVCLRNGKWSSPPPQCNNFCPPLDENEAFGVFYSNGRNINSEATFYCKDTNLVILGDHIKTCLPTGEWSAANPMCKDTVARCTRFTDQELNLLIVDYDDEDIRAGSTAIFLCKGSNQELRGRNETVCLRNGKWSSPPPQCKNLCPPIDENEAFVVFYSNGRNINSTATFYCKDTNLTIQGDHIKTCLPTGIWSAANPTCKDPVVRCPRFSDEDLNLVIARYDDEDNRAGSTAHFLCKYSDKWLSGKNESVCLINGTWSSPPPQCEGCGILPADYIYQLIDVQNGTKWPWLVAIRVRDMPLRCLGVLIDRRNVLVTSDCLYYDVDPSSYRVHIGRVNQSEDNIYNVSRITKKYLFSVSTGIAIFTLVSEVTTPGYNSICLPDEELSQKDLAGKVAVTEFRNTTDKNVNFHWTTRVMTIMDSQSCNRSVLAYFSRIENLPPDLSSNFICASYQGVIYGCRYFTCSPLIYQDKNRWYVIGVYLSNSLLFCSFGDYKFKYTGVSSNLDWITENTCD